MSQLFDNSADTRLISLQPSHKGATYSSDSSDSEDAVHRTDFAAEIQRGLTLSPKQISSRYLYDAEGNRLFGEIMHLPEYYLTRCEYELIETHKQAFLSLFAPDSQPFYLIDLGAGDGLKTKILLSHFLNEQANFCYVPVDISKEVLATLTTDIRQQWPDLDLQPQSGDYSNFLNRLPSIRKKTGARLALLFLGSNVGNFSPAEALNIYRQINQQLQTGDVVVTGFDLQKHPAVIHAAYNDSLGKTKAFNLNLLRRINRELGANFHVSAFSHYESYDPQTGEARSYLVSEKEQLVSIPALDLTVSFGEGEVIHTEISRKFTRLAIEQLAQQAGFTLTAWFSDARHYFADVVFQK